MRLLLDTQMALWWQAGDPRLGARARAFIGTNDGQVYVSTVSLWELAIKGATGRFQIDLSKFDREVERLGFEWLPIKNAHILHLPNLPIFPDHKDPFDRLLIAQSASEPLVLVTRDAKLARYGALVRVM